MIGPDKTGMHSWDGVCPVCKVEECEDCGGGTSKDASLRHDGKYPIVMRPVQTPGKPLPVEMALTGCACCGAAYWKEFERSLVLEEEKRIEDEYNEKVEEEKRLALLAEEERVEKVKKMQEEEEKRKKSIFDAVSPPESEVSEPEDSSIKKDDTPLERIRKSRRKKKED